MWSRDAHNTQSSVWSRDAHNTQSSVWSRDAHNTQSGHVMHIIHNHSFSYLALASYPGHVGGGKSGLVSTVCACANDSGNLPRTSPIMDKLHVVVMRRNNRTRYTACSVAAVVYAAMASIIRDTRGDTTRTTLQPPPVPLSLCLC